MQTKRKSGRNVRAALVLVALVLIGVGGNGITAQAATEEPDFLVLNPENE